MWCDLGISFCTKLQSTHLSSLLKTHLSHSHLFSGKSVGSFPYSQHGSSSLKQLSQRNLWFLSLLSKSAIHHTFIIMMIFWNEYLFIWQKKESISSKLPRRWIFILGKEVHFIYYEWRASNVTQTILNIGTFDVSSMVGNVHSNKNTISHDPSHWPAASEHNIFTMFILAELASCNWILWPVSWPEKRTSLSLLSFRDQKWW